jgi:hypothetical protein
MERYPGWRAEDRLTEVFACALAGVDELALWFVGKAGAAPPGPAPKFVIKTQVTRTGCGGRPDMAISYHDALDSECLILSEHKIDAVRTDFQIDQYADWDADKVVLVAPLSDIDAYGFDNPISWLDVGLAMNKIGTDSSSAVWRDIALKPDSPSRLRVLEETLAFIERQRVGVLLRPMTKDAIDNYELWPDTSKTMRTLLGTIREQLRAYKPNSPVKAWKENTQWSFGVGASWPYLNQLPFEQWAEVAIAPTDGWLDDGARGKAVLHAGFGFLVPNGQVPESMVAPGGIAVQLAAAPLAARVGHNPENRRHIVCAGLLYLDELDGETLAEQADTAAKWAEETIGAISRISDP